MPRDRGPLQGPIPKDAEELLRYGTRGHSLAAIAKLWGTSKQTIHNIMARRGATTDLAKLRAKVRRIAVQEANLATLLPPISAALMHQQSEILLAIAASKELCAQARAAIQASHELIENRRCEAEEAMLQRPETAIIIERIRELRRIAAPFKNGPLPEHK